MSKKKKTRTYKEKKSFGDGVRVGHARGKKQGRKEGYKAGKRSANKKKRR